MAQEKAPMMARKNLPMKAHQLTGLYAICGTIMAEPMFYFRGQRKMCRKFLQDVAAIKIRNPEKPWEELCDRTQRHYRLQAEKVFYSFRMSAMPGQHSTIGSVCSAGKQILLQVDSGTMVDTKQPTCQQIGSLPAQNAELIPALPHSADLMVMDSSSNLLSQNLLEGGLESESELSDDSFYDGTITVGQPTNTAYNADYEECEWLEAQHGNRPLHSAVTSPDYSLTHECPDVPFHIILRQWGLTVAAALSARDKEKLMDMLRKNNSHPMFQSLPKRWSTLVKRNKNHFTYTNYKMKQLNTKKDSQYCYIGIQKRLKQYYGMITGEPFREDSLLHTRKPHFKLIINVDGLEIGKSGSLRSVWPISMQVHSFNVDGYGEQMVKPRGHNPPLFVALYHASKQPECFVEFLSDLADELKLMHPKNICIGSPDFTCESLFVCDSPARIDCKQVLGLSSSYPCEKCHTKADKKFGAFMSIWKFSDLHLRTDSEFSTDKKHLKTRHEHSLQAHPLVLKALAQRVEFFRNLAPSEFKSSAILPLMSILNYKAAAMRHFVMYLAIPVFHGLVPPDIFQLLKVFVLSLYILGGASSEPVSPANLRKAQNLIENFVSTATHCHFSKSVPPTMHMFLHLTEDLAKQHCHMDRIGAWPFENAMKRIIRDKHSHRNVIQQIIRREDERLQHMLPMVNNFILSQTPLSERSMEDIPANKCYLVKNKCLKLPILMFPTSLGGFQLKANVKDAFCLMSAEKSKEKFLIVQVSGIEEEKTRGTEGASTKHSRTASLGLKSYLSTCETKLLWPLKVPLWKFDASGNSEILYLRGEDFLESPKCSRSMVLQNFANFPLPTSAFTEYSHSKSSLTFREFGPDYDSAIKWMYSLVDADLRMELPSSDGEVFGRGSIRKRSVPLPLTEQLQDEKKRKIYKKRMTQIKDVTTAKIAKEGNSSHHVERYIRKVASGSQALGPVALKNAKVRDTLKSVEDMKERLPPPVQLQQWHDDDDSQDTSSEASRAEDDHSISSNDDCGKNAQRFNCVQNKPHTHTEMEQPQFAKLQANVEKLQADIEELQTNNKELQSRNEKLEDKVEELQVNFKELQEAFQAYRETPKVPINNVNQCAMHDSASSMEPVLTNAEEFGFPLSEITDVEELERKLKNDRRVQKALFEYYFKHFYQEDEKTAIQSAVDAVFTLQFLRFKCLMVPRATPCDAGQTPVFLAKLNHLLINPLTRLLAGIIALKQNNEEGCAEFSCAENFLKMAENYLYSGSNNATLRALTMHIIGRTQDRAVDLVTRKMKANQPVERRVRLTNVYPLKDRPIQQQKKGCRKSKPLGHDVGEGNIAGGCNEPEAVVEEGNIAEGCNEPEAVAEEGNIAEGCMQQEAFGEGHAYDECI
ncbi:unnamed protein product, partial [Notodromas monacha]